MGLFLILSLTLPMNNHLYQNIITAFVLLGSVFVLILIIRSPVLKENPETWLYFAAFVIFIVIGGMSKIFLNYVWYMTGLLNNIFLIMCQGLVLSGRFSRTYHQLEIIKEEHDQLLAKNKKLLNSAAVLPKSLSKGSLRLDLIASRAFVDGKDLFLNSKEFSCLLLLSQNEGKTISTETIYQEVWKRPLNDNIKTLRTTIYTLRKKIDPSGYTITATRGSGYIFERI